MTAGGAMGVGLDKLTSKTESRAKNQTHLHMET